MSTEEAVGRQPAGWQALLHHLPDMNRWRSIVPPRRSRSGEPCATFRKPSRTIRVEPITRPAERERAAEPPKREPKLPSRSDRSPAPRRTRTRARP